MSRRGTCAARAALPDGDLDEALFFVRAGADLRAKREQAEGLFNATFAAIEPAQLETQLAEAQARV